MQTQSLAQSHGLDDRLITDWNTCTFVYLCKHNVHSYTFQLGRVSSQLTVQLGDDVWTVPNEKYYLLTRMFYPATVYAPDYREASSLSSSSSYS